MLIGGDWRQQTQEIEEEQMEGNISKVGSSSSSDDLNPCPICLGPVVQESYLDKCLHKFCYNCILHWTKVVSSKHSSLLSSVKCPLCKTENLSIVHGYDGINFQRHYISQTIGDSFVFSKAHKYRLQCYYTEPGILNDIFNVTRYWKTRKYLHSNQWLQSWLRREIQALMQEEDVEIVVHHIVGVVDSFQRRDEQARQKESPETKQEKFKAAVSEAARPFVIARTDRFVNEMELFLASGLNIEAYDAIYQQRLGWNTPRETIDSSEQESSGQTFVVPYLYISANTFYNNENGHSGHNNKRSSEGVLAPANWRRNGESQSSGTLGVNIDRLGNENKVKKVKLKVGGVTRTIHANAIANGAPGGGSSMGSQSSDDSRMRQKQNLQADDGDKRGGLQGIPWKDFSRGGFGFGKEDSVMGKGSGKNSSGKQGDQSGPVRKSKRVPKKRVLDGEFDDEEDDEIRYLEKLKSSKVSAGYREDDEESGTKHRKFSRVSNFENIGSSKSGIEGKKRSRPDRVSEDTTDYEEDEELASDGEVEGNQKKKQKKESVDSLMDNKREMTLTTRQRALQSSKDASTPGSSLIEFPNGLPPAPSRKKKEKLSDMEQQLKKAEAAQRRRIQVEKANRESEAEAIRKILGQDSSRKKKEDQKKKRQEELAQEKAAIALNLASSTIRWVMGPTGTVVTFPKEMGFPSIFDSKPGSYPPPRESCAGPSCANPYRYRDSKSKLPLCSLRCYKAIQGRLQAETTC